jgi:hypothetical protein
MTKRTALAVLVVVAVLLAFGSGGIRSATSDRPML